MISLAASVSLSAAAAAAPHGRQLSYTNILNYNTGSEVTDHANVDLDQKEMEARLSASYDFTGAKLVYTDGAYSKPTATCTIAGSGTLGQAVAKKDSVSFMTMNGDSVTGKAYAAYDSTDTDILFTYPVAPLRVEPTVSQCYTGGKNSPSTLGCINETAGITVDSTTYAVTCTNSMKRTLQGFSTKAKSVMNDCPVDTTVTYENGCPYTSYKPYYDYYGVYDYANQIVLAALDGTAAAGLTNGAIDLTGAADVVRGEFAKKGTAYMNTWMYTIREFEDAIDDCTGGDLTANALSSGPVHAWDEGVAFYTGSLMKFDDLLAGDLPTLDSKGKQPYTLANKRCKNFVTCGPDGDALVGEAKVNVDLFNLFTKGQYELLAGNCAKVVPIKDEIVSKMSVPLIQGTLRYAFKMAHLSGADKEKAEGGIFAAAILPQVHKCDPAAATTIYNNMKWGAASTDFMAVKTAFEGCYTAMGITCKDVGGLWNTATSDYYADSSGDSSAAPCVDASTGMDTGTIVAIAVGAGVAALCLCILVFMMCKEKAGKPIFTNLQEGKGAKGGSA